MKTIYAALTDPGLVREENQDRFVADPKHALFIVSDGMGGRPLGGVAAEIVVRSLPVQFDHHWAQPNELSSSNATEMVLNLIRELSRGLRRQSEGHHGQDGMGATVVMALIQDWHALIAHLGDSRAYLFRAGKLELLTHDHSLTQLLVDCGEITSEEAINHPSKSQLTRFVGMPEEPMPEGRVIPISQGDRLLLCSDGLTNMMTDAEIQHILTVCPDVDGACQKMVHIANEAGGEDNVTVVVIAVE